MITHLLAYSTFVFDCDGVILDSNCIKTKAFRAAALPWGTAAAESLVAHHVANGGVSRNRKFAYFLNSILPRYYPEGVPGRDGPGLEDLLRAYSQEVRRGLMTCAVADGLETLRSVTSDARWCIVSGGNQAELRAIFSARGLDTFFDAGIFGSPDSKEKILTRELAAGTIQKPALFLGDSRYDQEIASLAGFEFIFVSGWSEFAEWKAFVAEKRLRSVEHLRNLIIS